MLRFERTAHPVDVLLGFDGDRNVAIWMCVELTDASPLGLLTAKDGPNVVVRVSTDSLEAEAPASICQIGYDTMCTTVFEVYDGSTKRFMLSVLDNAGETPLCLLRVESVHAGDHE